MNRIDELFSKKRSGILSVYFTAGFPEKDNTTDIITALEKFGADIVEIGMPFSDPVADGPVIQESSHIALQNGMSLSLLTDQIKGIRKKVSIPLVLMGYFNPVLQYGIERLCRKLSSAGIDGLIIPDLPPEEYEEKYKNIFNSYNLHNILLVTPQTSPARIMLIDSISSGFIYMVSSASTTGGRLTLDTDRQTYFSRMASMSLSNPLMIGFGISDKKSLKAAWKYAAGGIIGSAFIKSLESGEGTIHDKTRRFMKDIT